MELRRIGRVVGRGVRLRCPACGVGRPFAGWFRMRLRCPACGLTFEREPGYFVGAIYLNYAATALLAILGYFVVHAWLAPPVTQELLLWGAFVVLFPLWFYRYSKCLWLSLDHLVDPVEPRGDR